MEKAKYVMQPDENWMAFFGIGIAHVVRLSLNGRMIIWKPFGILKTCWNAINTLIYGDFAIKRYLELCLFSAGTGVWFCATRFSFKWIGVVIDP